MGRGIDFKCQCGHEYKDYYGTGFIGEDFLPDEKLKAMSPEELENAKKYMADAQSAANPGGAYLIKQKDNPEMSFTPDDLRVLHSINYDLLEEMITELTTLPKDWAYKPKTEVEGKHITLMPAEYPFDYSRMYKMFKTDQDYEENKKRNCDGVLISDMNPSQLATLLTFYLRGEHFCDGFLGGVIVDHSLVKVLLRFEDFYNDYFKKEG